MRTNFSLAAAIVIAGAVVSSVSPDVAAAQQLYVRLDNYPNGGEIFNTQTQSTISVSGFFCKRTAGGGVEGEWFTFGARALPTVSGSHDFYWDQSQRGAEGYGQSGLMHILVKTNGSDWFWLDQLEVRLFDLVGYSRGVDNTQGWCFSTNPSHGNETVCEPNGSRTFYEFVLHTSCPI